MSEAVELAARIAERLGGVEGVAAVALGGTRARGDASPDSDLDLGIYYRPESPPAIDELRALARDGRTASAGSRNGFRGAGEWINGGGWLYRDLGEVERVIHTKRAIIRKHLWETGFALDTARKPARRGGVFYVTGCLFQCVACPVQALFALDERYLVNEKGSVRLVETFELRPERFEATVAGVLLAPAVRPGWWIASGVSIG